jgi:tyrosyl-tRNA synthetase
MSHTDKQHTESGQSLRDRGLIAQVAGGSLDDVLSQPRHLYVGVEPSADSIHIGNLVPIILAKHLLEMGHKVSLLVGGATGLIGDPKESSERPLLGKETVAKNVEAIRLQISDILKPKQGKIEVFDNAEWLSKVGVIDFLRDIGKHFSVNQLIKRDIIKRRLDSDDDGISYTEFSYSLLQAYDFMHLNALHGIDLQLGGSDQWANMISGVDLIRRRNDKQSFALTTPIIVDKSTGKKFGKSEGNAVWLNPAKTSPFNFYQFWINVIDENAEDYLKVFTFLPLAEIADIVAKHNEQPQDRLAQKTLAREMTTFVHGVDAAATIERISTLLYADDSSAVFTATDWEIIGKEVPSVSVSEVASAANAEGAPIADVLVAAGLATSKTEARRLLEGGSVSVNGETLPVGYVFTKGDPKTTYALLKKGKKIAGILP